MSTIEFVVVCRDNTVGTGVIEPLHPWAGVPVELITANPEDITEHPEDM